MKHLIVAVFISQVFLLTEALAISLPDGSRSDLESLVQCHWLIASNAEEQEEQQVDSAEDDEEPDCD